jgi:hypothetical protein
MSWLHCAGADVTIVCGMGRRVVGIWLLVGWCVWLIAG